MIQIGQEIKVKSGVRKDKQATVIDVLDAGYYYVLVDTHIPHRRVKVVLHHTEFETQHTVVGFYEESGQIFSDHVWASGPSAAMYSVASARADACLICAISGWLIEGQGIDFSGESVVDAETVLDQPEVFKEAACEQ